MNWLSCMLIIGVGATLVMDLWGMIRRPLLGLAPPDYGLVGRWLAGLAHGRFSHPSIAQSPPVPGERLLGWAAHYLIGIAFAAILLVTAGPTWIQQPSLMPALLVGILTVAAPFLIMQPAMGAGIAASRTPRPTAARLQSLLTHAVFGIGLYAAAFLARAICAPPR